MCALKGNHVNMVDTIGSAKKRLEILKMVIQYTSPIWPKNLETIKEKILKISAAILPEIESPDFPLASEFKSALDDFYMGKILPKKKINQSWELTTLILLPLMGYTAAFTYSHN